MNIIIGSDTMKLIVGLGNPGKEYENTRHNMGFDVLNVVAKKYNIEDKMPILIAEKMGPHFAVGDTCYNWSEDIKVYNPNGKEIVAKDNSVSIQRREDVSKAYFHCHTDITIPYEELKHIMVVTKAGDKIMILEDGEFVLSGTEILNEPLKNSNR